MYYNEGFSGHIHQCRYFRASSPIKDGRGHIGLEQFVVYLLGAHHTSRTARLLSVCRTMQLIVANTPSVRPRRRGGNWGGRLQTTSSRLGSRCCTLALVFDET